MPELPTDPRRRELYDLAVRIGLAWREIRRGASTADLREYLYGHGDNSVEQGQMDTMDVLASRDSWRMSELAEELRVDPSTATRAVQRLVNSELATRNHSSDDGRVVQVELTAAGRAVYESVAARREELFTFILSSYRAKELPVFAEMLERFVAALDTFVDAHRSTDD